MSPKAAQTNTRRLFDSTEWRDIPELGEGDLVAGYANGAESAWPAAGWEAYPAALRIDVKGENVGNVLDIEKGDATIASAPGWVAKRQANGVLRPWLYVDLSHFDELRQVMGAAEVGYWVADWTGEAHDVAGADATQWANPEHSGGHFDLSSVVGTVPSEAAPPPVNPGGFDVATLPTIQQGASGKTTQSVQALLNVHANADLATDGLFGPLTEQKVRDFQTVLHIADDGIVGPVTWAALIQE